MVGDDEGPIQIRREPCMMQESEINCPVCKLPISECICCPE